MVRKVYTTYIEELRKGRRRDSYGKEKRQESIKLMGNSKKKNTK